MQGRANTQNRSGPNRHTQKARPCHGHHGKQSLLAARSTRTAAGTALLARASCHAGRGSARAPPAQGSAMIDGAGAAMRWCASSASSLYMTLDSFFDARAALWRPRTAPARQVSSDSMLCRHSRITEPDSLGPPWRRAGCAERRGGQRTRLRCPPPQRARLRKVLWRHSLQLGFTGRRAPAIPALLLCRAPSSHMAARLALL